MSFIKSIWGEPSKDINFISDILMLTANDQTSQEVYEDHIEPVIKNNGLTIHRVDDMFSIHTTMHGIWSSIYNSRIVIADCTSRDSSVFYQLGIAHTLGKPFVLISENSEDIPFDLRQYKHITYTYTSAKMRNFEVVLGDVIKSIKTYYFKGDKEELIEAAPIWGEPSEHTQYNADIFMIMPFRENLTAIYEQYIKPRITQKHLSIKRGDDFFAVQAIMNDVWSGIYNSKLTIAECTERNPNVFYEIGIAHTLGKPVILITQNAEDVPRELRNLRYILYKDKKRELELMVKKLEEGIQSILDE